MLPLEGIRVLDVSRLLPGPYGTMLLADMGAEVIKISQPGYRSTIMTQRPAVDRNKKSISLNLKTKEAQQIFYELVERSDVVVEGFRPGVAHRLGIDYLKVKEINPRIIYCSITGYGQDGPYRDLPGHDPNYISISGILGITGTPDGRHVIPGIPISDLAGGMQVAFSILCALWAREKTKTGQYIDVSITDVMISWLGVTRGDNFLRTGQVFRRGERPSHVYKTKEGKYICIAPIEFHFWERLCRLLKIDQYISDHNEILIFQPPNPQKREEIINRLTEIFLTKTRQEWMELFHKEDIPATPVYEIEEVFNDPHFQSRKMIEEITSSEGEKLRQVGIAVKFSQTPGKIKTAPPVPGANTVQILLDLGYDISSIEELRNKGIIEYK